MARVRLVSQTRLFRRFFPLLVAGTTVAVVVGSGVTPNLWVLSGRPAYAAAVSYAGLMVWLACAPPQGARVHGAAAALAVLVTAGRAGGFLELVVDLGRWDLVGATLERVVIMTALLMWHQAAAFDHARRIEDPRVGA